MKLTEIKRVLEAGDIQLTKSLGQNFLHDANQLRRIVEAVEISEADQLLEIGPGLGALTHLLLDRHPAKLLALEKDQRLYDYLRNELSGAAGFELRHVDALDYLKQQRIDWSAWKLASNLPYSVASPILVELAKAPGAPQRIVATLQLEVAERLLAAAGQQQFGILSLLIQVHYQPTGLFKIPASCFFPVPDVDSACVILIRRARPLVEPGQFRAFEKLVKRGFSQRRKMMFKLLKADWSVPQLDDVFGALNISRQARAETVSLDTFVKMTKLLAPIGAEL